ncbi:Dihydrolipoyl dehydrogenase [Metallosphaera sp. J1]|uniref:mercury(II) reductase n=1 Tax=Metallosphaera javensis (ex Hofmann et al. 2022) TaxID=99938 RepID=UPI001EDF59BD|nr:mercury(II) reductase [Metallosphaera javensis (ex Hofmann et al. 2022)]MCG3109121.1 Dihydrolipoyl dehydrogenase [Metallosphaera javensis (ex Hofmann et al. 2022)]
MYKLAIIGYGASGFAGMIKANELGVKPVLIGKGEVGGTCVNVGCVPSKRMLHVGEIYKVAREVTGSEVYPEFTAFREKDLLVQEMRKTKYEDLLSYYDVELIQGEARFVSPHAVKVNGKVIEAEKFLIATGSSPLVPDIPGIREVGFWTNREALSPDRKIDSLVVIGGRALALEFAQMYRRMNVDVAILQRSSMLIPDWEPEASIEARRIMEREGISVVTGVRVKEVRRGAGKVVVTDKGEVEADEILLATGRKPNVELGLENAGISLNERGGIRVNQELRTDNPNVYAAGDVLGGKMLEALAGRQGSVAVENALTGSHKTIDENAVPQVIFTQPNLARVGLTEVEARTREGKVESRVLPMSSVAKAEILDARDGFVKMVTLNGKVVGVHAVGENVAEMIGEASLAIRLGASVDDLVETVHVFPTIAESLRLVALAFRSDVSRLSCCV